MPRYLVERSFPDGLTTTALPARSKSARSLQLSAYATASSIRIPRPAAQSSA